jgi:hypothetical protein
MTASETAAEVGIETGTGLTEREETAVRAEIGRDPRRRTKSRSKCYSTRSISPAHLSILTGTDHHRRTRKPRQRRRLQRLRRNERKNSELQSRLPNSTCTRPKIILSMTPTSPSNFSGTRNGTRRRSLVLRRMRRREENKRDGSKQRYDALRFSAF